MNLELIKHTFLHHEFDSPEEETYIMRGHIDTAIKELGEIKRNLGTAIADMNRTGDDSGLQEVYVDLDAFLNPSIYEPTHSETDSEIDYEARYNAIIKVAQENEYSLDVDDIAKGSYQQGLDDALDPIVQATVDQHQGGIIARMVATNKALSDYMAIHSATIDADGEVTYK